MAGKFKSTPLVAEGRAHNVLTAEVLYDALTATSAMSHEQYALATEHYVRYIRATHDVEYAKHIARLMTGAGEYVHATTIAKLLLELPSDEQKAHQWVLMSALKSEDYATVLTQLDWALNDLGKGRYDLVVNELYGILQGNSEKAFVMGLLLRLQNRYPQDSSAQRLVVRLFLRYHEQDKAWEALEKAVALNAVDPKTVRLKAQIYVGRNQRKKAIEYLERVLVDSPDMYIIRHDLARLLLKEGAFERAKNQYLYLLQLGSEKQRIDTQYTLGLLMMDLRQLSEARHYFEQLIIKNSGYVNESHYYLGLADQMSALLPSAIESFKKVAQGSAYWIDAQYQAGRLMAETEGADNALGFLRGLDVGKPEDKKAVLQLQAQILFNEKRLEEAQAIYDAALLEFPGDTDVLYAKGILLSEMPDISAAESVFLEVLRQKPSDAHTLNALGYILADKTVRHNEALAYIRRAIELLPNDFSIMDSMGWVQYRLGDYESSIQYLLKAYDGKSDPEIASHLGEVFWVKGDMEQAREVWGKALLDFPKNEGLIEVIERYDY